MKITHWNLGSRFCIRKSDEIQHILDTRRPDVMIISEANSFREDQDFQLWTPGYTMVKTKSLETLGVCRMTALINDGALLEVIDSWMDPEIVSIWLRVNKRGNKMYLGGVYREHSILKQRYPTDREELQYQRWEKCIRQWEVASHQADCILLGDTNLDMLKWQHPDQIYVGMTNLVNNDIKTIGHHQLIRGPTRFWVCFPRSSTPGLDN